MLIEALLPMLAAAIAGPAQQLTTAADGAAARQDAVYSTSNPRHPVSSFGVDGYRDGLVLCYLSQCPTSPIRRLQPSVGVQCISLGAPGNTVEYALRRPIKAGDRYSCLGTSFRVLRCFDRCNGAVVQREWRSVNGRVQRASLYVERCRGVVAFSHDEDMPGGIPFDAQLLRGAVGILADPDDPGC